MMNPVVHFEMPATDSKRMVEFYSTVFGWKPHQMGPDYTVVHTSECDANNMPAKPGRINGGFYKKTPDMPLQHPSVVIAVEDVDVHMKKVTDAGGQVLGEPMDIPGIGRYVSIIDTEGNRLSIIQPLMGMDAA